MVYLIAFICTLIAAYFNNRMTPTQRKCILIVICAYVVLILGFRFEVGVDTLSYMHAYNKIPTIEHFFSTSTFERSRFEPGFLFICSLCKTFSNDFWPLQIVMAAITNVCIFIFLYQNCKNVFVGVLLYFIMRWLYFSTEIMRESAAIGIFLLNFRNLQKRRWLKYYLFSILSILFHYSAIIIWFFPFVKILNNKIIFYVSCIVFLLITPLVEQLNELLQIAAVYGRIDQYTTGTNDLNMNWRIGELIRSAIPAMVTLMGYHFIKERSKFDNYIKLQIIFCMGAFAIPLIFSRFTNYTSLFVIAAASDLINLLKLHNRLKIIFVCLIILSQANYYRVYYKIWIPYHSVFYPEKSVDRHIMYRDVFLQWMNPHKKHKKLNS